MKLSQLKTVARLANKLDNILRESGKLDPAMASLAEESTALWSKLHDLRTAAELKAAERKDRGAVLWEVFIPSKDGGMEIVTRTPNRLMRESRQTYSPVHRSAFVTTFGMDATFRRAMDGHAY